MKKIIVIAALLLAACKTQTPPDSKPENNVVESTVEAGEFKLPSESIVPPTDTPSGPIVSKSADGFAFKRKQFTLRNVNVKMVYYQHAADLNAEYKKQNGTVPYALAFSVYKDGFCEIHVLDPSLSYEPALIGHELMHCFHGKFHD